MIKKVLIILVAALAFAATIYFTRSQQLAEESADSVAAEAPSTGPTVADAPTAPLRSQGFDYQELLRVVGSLNETQRNQVLADEKLFQQVVKQEALRLSFIDAAKASEFANDKNMKYLLQRQADDYLVNGYIKNRLDAAGLPEGFPAEQQLQQFYEQNQQRYTLAERLPVWQIFWPIGKDASKPDVAKLVKKASLVAGDIKKGKISFEEAALVNSEHTASRLKGGYMGMLLTSELRPEIKDKLLSLKQGKISQPIRGDTGLHVFRRGPIQPAEVLSLGQVRSQVTSDLTRVLRSQQRSQLNKLVQQQYPVNLDQSQLQEWMTRAGRHFSQNGPEK